MVLFLLSFVMFFRISPALLEGDTYKRQSQGLLKRWLDPEPVATGVVFEVAAHGNPTRFKYHVVRIVFYPQVRTRRPIVASSANIVQLTREVITQGGQVEIITCVSCIGEG